MSLSQRLEQLENYVQQLESREREIHDHYQRRLETQQRSFDELLFQRQQDLEAFRALQQQLTDAQRRNAWLEGEIQTFQQQLSRAFLEQGNLDETIRKLKKEKEDLEHAQRSSMMLCSSNIAEVRRLKQKVTELQSQQMEADLCRQFGSLGRLTMGTSACDGESDLST